MSNTFKHPKNRMIIFLLLLLVTATPRFGLPQVVALLLPCVGFTVLADALFTLIRTKRFVVPHSSLITGLILTLIIDPGVQWYQVLVISMAAMATKVFLRPTGRHIFNPAASGLFVGWLLFRLYPSWWAPSPYDPGRLTVANAAIFIPVLLIAYVSCVQLRKYYAVISYLAASWLLAQWVNGFDVSAAISSTVGSPGTLFYTLVMLVEPKTSPVKKVRQVLYGMLVAVIASLVVYLSGKTTLALFDASLTALLLGNAVFFKFK